MPRIEQLGWRRGDAPEYLLTREWLITNSLGGYASGTIGPGAFTESSSPPLLLLSAGP